ncbi:hypothetical protein [Millisia brevis]|uniref:hypothetical protein n=1 Tax=Millisia brevis TaxID=264148 RepID=UPI00082E30A3|nr:hypothetical protein [Millisia brevis]
MVVIPLLLLAPAVSTFTQIFDEDAIVPADGNSHTVRIDSPGDRLLFMRDGGFRPECTVTGAQTAPLGGELTVNSWYAFDRIVSPPSQFEILCASPSPTPVDVRIAPAGSLGQGVLLMVGAIFTGIFGFIWLVLLAVVRHGRRREALYWGGPGHS